MRENHEILTVNKPWNIHGQRVLVIPDCHQNIYWVKAILREEEGNFDVVVFLGDFFDSFKEPPEVYSIKETAQFVAELIEGKWGNAKVLLGNHDLAYLEAWRQSSKFRNPRQMFNACSGFSNNKSTAINTTLKWQEHWKKFNLFLVCNGWLLTHAGVRINYWHPLVDDPVYSLDKLYHQFDEAVDHVNAFPHPLFTCGMESGGRAAWGGPLWCRPDTFEDELPLPQVFGHTFSGDCGIFRLGRCINIDGGQTSYLFIEKNGEITPRALDRSLKQRTVVEKRIATQAEINVKIDAELKRRRTIDDQE